jgi:DUF1680 family protein
VTPLGYRQVPLDAVRITSPFWTERLATLRTVTLPYQYEILHSTGRIDALRGDWRPGQGPEPHIFWDSDVAKWIEAASYSLAVDYDAELDARVDGVIELLAAAQQEDGYLNTYFTVVRPGQRFTDLRDAHELYCAGHLIEAGVAHAQATGKKTLLDTVCRMADHIDRTFGTEPGKKRGYPGHEEIELALVKLYRATGEPRYLRLSGYFIDERGTQPYYFEQEALVRGTPGYFGHQPPFDTREADPERFREYNQSHLPVREQTRVVGHAVRAMYLFTGMADLAAETGDASLVAACERLWTNLTSRQMYVTGGLGPSAEIEGFTSDFDLPNEAGYAETCAAVGLVFWAHRMALLTGEARYVDVLERALYNAVISGVSLDGRHYFYGNPLRSAGGVSRQEWFEVACCPPNLARLLASLGGYAYATGPDELVVNLYLAGSLSTEVAGQAMTLRQESDLPWAGDVGLEVSVPVPTRFTLALRVPDWCEQPTVRVNGAPVDVRRDDRGYLRLAREWRGGDQVRLDLPMPVRRVYAHPRVREDAGLVAIARGPLVYCIEQVDHAEPLHELSLPRSAAFAELPHNELGRRLTAVGRRDSRAGWGDTLYRSAPPELEPASIVAVPYYAWNNRGAAAMRVWVREHTDMPEGSPAPEGSP